MYIPPKVLSVEELEANRKIISVQKYGFFLCEQGEAEILLGSQVYHISRHYLCIYTPNSFLHILQRSDDLKGILIEEDVEELHPCISQIGIKQRLTIRNAPCLLLTEEQARNIKLLVGLTETATPPAPAASGTVRFICNEQRHYLLSALCMEVLKVYFSSAPVAYRSASKEEQILNRFLLSVYEHFRTWRSVQYYAGEQHLSSYYFSTIIRRCSGRSALEWIEHITISFAKQYLKYSDKSIKEIAMCLNFPDPSTFGRYFKRYENISPQAYRDGLNSISRSAEP